jgi:hypothetical protein
MAVKRHTMIRKRQVVTVKRRRLQAVRKMLASSKHTRIMRGNWKLLVLPAGIWVRHRGERLFIPHGEPERSFQDVD